MTLALPRSPAALLALCAGLGACAHPSGDRPFISALQLRGVYNVSARALERGLVSKPTAWWRRGAAHAFDELELARDRLRVRRYYEEHGYYAAEVVLAEAKPKPNTHAVEVVIAVEEGAPTLIGDVAVMGLGDVEPATQAKLRAAQRGLRRGQVFHHADYETFKLDLLRLLTSNGFPHAKITGLVDVVAKDNLVNITVTANPSGADPGPQPAPDNAKPQALAVPPERS